MGIETEMGTKQAKGVAGGRAGVRFARRASCPRSPLHHTPMPPRKDIVIGDPASDDDFISDEDDLYDGDGKGKKGKGKVPGKKNDKGKGKATEVRLGGTRLKYL